MRSDAVSMAMGFSKSQAYNPVGFLMDSSLIGCNLSAFTRSTAHPAPGCDFWLSKIAKGKMHEQPRWIAREVVMEGDEWRRFRDAVDSGAGIEAIKLLRIFWIPSMHVSLAEVVKR